jgi:serine/threonine protein kinase
LKDLCALQMQPENVLLDAAGHVRLADFGLSRYAGVSSGGDDDTAFRAGNPAQDDISHSFCGTEKYMAPELLLRTGHSAAVDWWSLGVLASEMMTGSHPFQRDTHLETLQAIVDPLAPPATLDALPPLAASLVRALLHKDPSQRLGSAASGGLPALLQHPFFRARSGPGLPPTPLDWRRCVLRHVSQKHFFRRMRCFVFSLQRPFTGLFSALRPFSRRCN